MKRIIDWIFRRNRTRKFEIDGEAYADSAYEAFPGDSTVEKLIRSEAERIKSAARSYVVNVHTPEKKSASGFIISEAKDEEETRYEPYYKSSRSTRNYHYINSVEGKVVALVPKELCSTPRQ